MRATTELSVAEAGWALLCLAEAGVACRAGGRCVGVLRADDVRVEAWGLRRTVPGSRARLMRLRMRMARHRRRGHDLGCDVLGVPLNSMRLLTRAWCGEQGELLLMDAVAEALSQLADNQWREHGGAVAALRHAIGGRITVNAPADMCREAA